MKIGFVGDTSFTGMFREQLLSGEPVLSPELQKWLQVNDYNVCNFEGPATDASNTLRTDLRIVSPPQSVSCLSKQGFNIFDLANNHVFDCGEKGFSDTLQEMQKADVRHFGAGRNLDEASQILYLEDGIARVALLGFTHQEGMIASNRNAGVFCETHSALVERRIREAKSNADWVVLNYHGGEEFTLYPMPRRRKFLQAFSDHGVDVIIAHHAHVFQGTEQVQNMRIFYSLGNFIFDVPILRARSHTAQSGLMVLDFKKKSFDCIIHPLRIDYEQGRVDVAELFDPTLETLSDFSDYPDSWRREAARVIRELRKPIPSAAGMSAAEGKLSLINKLKKGTKEIVGLLRNPVKRSLYTAAFRYILSGRSRTHNSK